jgi:very-short-patch-repair endonuclease
VDFVCFQARLVIELDGSQHQDRDADRTRDAWLAQHGFRVLRFWDNEVLTEPAAVLERIAASLSPSPPTPLPRGERGVSCPLDF